MKIIEETKNNFTEQRIVYNFFMTGARISDVSGGGDMTKAVYDPGGVNDDAFDMENMSEGTTNKILSAAGKGAISGSENPSTANPFITKSASQKLTNATITGAHTVDIDDLGKYTKFDSDITISDATVTAYSEGQTFSGRASAELIILTSGAATYSSKGSGTTVADGGSFLATRLPAADAFDFHIAGGLT